MDEYQEIRFGMDKDFEGAQFMGDEFYYRKRKDKFVQSKDDALYGVFASGSSDSDEHDDGKKRKRKKGGGLIKKNEYSKPVNFISTGIVAPNDQENSREEENREDDEGGSEAAFKPGVGLGVNVGVGLGFESNGMNNRAGKGMVGVKSEGDVEAEGNEDEYSFLPTTFGKNIKEAAEKRREKARSGSSSVNDKSHLGGGAKRNLGTG